MFVSGYLPITLAAAIDLPFLAVLLPVVTREIVAGRNWKNHAYAHSTRQVHPVRQKFDRLPLRLFTHPNNLLLRTRCYELTSSPYDHEEIGRFVDSSGNAVLNR